MAVIQHRDILEVSRHPPKSHSISSHSAVASADRGKFVKTDAVTGEIEFDASSIPTYLGDPVSPGNGNVWYDGLNDRLRVKLDSGKGTIAVILDT